MPEQDSIIVLGRGITADGSLPPDPQKRVEIAVAEYQKGHADYLIMSGKWSFRAEVPFPKTEAQAMKDYAVSLGIPADHILLEEDSTETIGNAYYVKTNILEPRGWKKAAVISSQDHIERTRYVFDTVMGPNYKLEYITSPNVLAREAAEAMAKKEQRSMGGTRLLLQDLTAGDNAAIAQILHDYGPGYAQDDETRQRAWKNLNELMKLHGLAPRGIF